MLVKETSTYESSLFWWQIFLNKTAIRENLLCVDITRGRFFLQTSLLLRGGPAQRLLVHEAQKILMPIYNKKQKLLLFLVIKDRTHHLISVKVVRSGTRDAWGFTGSWIDGGGVLRSGEAKPPSKVTFSTLYCFSLSLTTDH